MDENRVMQVLINLISNAIKFSPSAGKIAIRGSRTGNEIKVTVQDRGIGMSQTD